MRHHKNLTEERWQKLSFFDQMANVGSEVGRAIKRRNKRNIGYSRLSFERALELMDLTISDAKNIERLRELTRVRESLADYFEGTNICDSSDESWENYFLAFNHAARRRS